MPIIPTNIKYLITLCFFCITLPLDAAENGKTDITTPNNEVIIDQTVQALKKKLGLTAGQIDSLLKNAASLKSSDLNETTLTDKLNVMLVDSGVTGAQIINRHDPLFWLYRARFGVTTPQAPGQIPAWLTRRGNNWHVYVASNLERTDSKDKQLRRGDEITFDAGQPLVFSDETATAGTTVSVRVKSLSWDKPKSAEIKLEQKGLEQLLLEIVQTNNAKHATGKTATGYLMLPSTDLQDIRTSFIKSLQDYEKTTDQLMVDLRGPYGEGGLSGIDMFLNDKGERVNYSKPLYLLIDRYTSGGREILAGMLQRHAGAILAGEPTAGNTAAIELTELAPERFILVSEQRGNTDAQPLRPNLPIKENLMFAAGQDEIVTRTLGFIAKK